jgi:hypothetical protein
MTSRSINYDAQQFAPESEKSELHHLIVDANSIIENDIQQRVRDERKEILRLWFFPPVMLLLLLIHFTFGHQAEAKEATEQHSRNISCIVELGRDRLRKRVAVQRKKRLDEQRKEENEVVERKRTIAKQKQLAERQRTNRGDTYKRNLQKLEEESRSLRALMLNGDISASEYENKLREMKATAEGIQKKAQADQFNLALPVLLSSQTAHSIANRYVSASSLLDALKERFLNGELSKEEYQRLVIQVRESGSAEESRSGLTEHNLGRTQETAGFCASCGTVLGEVFFKCKQCGTLNCMNCRDGGSRLCIKCSPKSSSDLGSADTCRSCGQKLPEEYFKCRICGGLFCLECRDKKNRCCRACAAQSNR